MSNIQIPDNILEQIIKSKSDIENLLTETKDQSTLIDLSKKLKKITQKADYALKIKKVEKEISGNKDLLANLSPEDQEMKEMLELEIINQEETLANLSQEILALLAPADTRDDNNVMLEIRAGAGGDEASLFAKEMAEMYINAANYWGLKAKIQSFSPNDLGGYKEVIMEISGSEAYSYFKYEAGVHRVQRFPATEKQGRIHTSTVSVLVMPLLEADSDFKLDLKDVEIIASTSQGAGGQSVNTTYSAIKVKHIPTGIEAQSQDERNQQQNKIKALQVLTSRVFDHYEEIRLAKEAETRKEQVKSADRSEKIRTYNFPQDRLTDHRYSQNWNQLPLIMAGEIYKIITEIKQIEAKQNLENLVI